MATQVLFFNVFSEKDPHVNAVEYFLFVKLDKTLFVITFHV